MNPGELNHRITVEIQDQFQANENGFPVKEKYIFWKKLWSKKQGLGGRVFYAAAAVQSETDVIFKVRYRKDITTDMRIVDDVGIYNIKAAVDKDGKREFLWITASEVTPK